MLEFIVLLIFCGEAKVNENITVYSKINPPKECEIKIEYHTQF